MSAEKKKTALVLSIYRELAEEFLNSFAPESKTDVPIHDFLVNFEILAGDPAQDPAFSEHLARADAIALVVRFLDVLSLEKIKNIYRSLPDALTIPVSIFMLRDKGESDFKISCPSCGQKLWLRDTDVSKRGRCPNCTKPFVILSQGDHLKSQLMLPDKIETFKVTRNVPESFRTGLVKLFGGTPAGIKPADLSVSDEALSNATVRIQIQNT